MGRGYTVGNGCPVTKPLLLVPTRSCFHVPLRERSQLCQSRLQRRQANELGCSGVAERRGAQASDFGAEGWLYEQHASSSSWGSAHGIHHVERVSAYNNKNAAMRFAVIASYPAHAMACRTPASLTPSLLSWGQWGSTWGASLPTSSYRCLPVRRILHVLENQPLLVKWRRLVALVSKMAKLALVSALVQVHPLMQTPTLIPFLLSLLLRHKMVCHCRQCGSGKLFPRSVQQREAWSTGVHRSVSVTHQTGVETVVDRLFVRLFRGMEWCRAQGWFVVPSRFRKLPQEPPSVSEPVLVWRVPRRNGYARSQ